MPKHTVTLEKEELRIINIVKAVKDIKSIDKALSYIVQDYASTKGYSKLLKEVKRED